MLFLQLTVSNSNSSLQSQLDRLAELERRAFEMERRAYEGSLGLYEKCVWTYNRWVNDPMVKGGTLFEVCGEPPIPPKSVEDAGDSNCGSPEGIVDRSCWYSCENGQVTWPGRGDCPVVGTPYIIDLAFKNGSISQANNITYQVKFDFGGDESILSIDKGSFDDAVKRDAETIIFNANNLSQNQNKSGVVILNAENNNVSKAIIYTNLTINGITRTGEIDPAGPSILSIATEIIDLVDKGFKTATNIAEQITPCINLDSQADDSQPEDDIAEYLVTVINVAITFRILG